MAAKSLRISFQKHYILIFVIFQTPSTCSFSCYAVSILAGMSLLASYVIICNLNEILYYYLKYLDILVHIAQTDVNNKNVYNKINEE